MLEALEHEDNSFLTLTYSDQHLPSNGLVCPRALQLFIKRLRKASNRKLRFYGVGEYGELTHRPHYHLALFGYPTCDLGRTHAIRKECCEQCNEIRKVWGKGNIVLGSLTGESAAYIAGYVTKKSVEINEETRKPFARMSNRPGIGAGAMDDVASTLMEAGYSELDVPSSMNHGQGSWPLGRYLRRRLRIRMGMDEKAPGEVMAAMAKELQPLLEKAREYAPQGHLREVFKHEIVQASEPKRLKQEFWQKVRQQKRNIV